MTTKLRNSYGYAFVWLLQHTWHDHGFDGRYGLINTLIYLAKRSN